MRNPLVYKTNLLLDYLHIFNYFITFHADAEWYHSECSFPFTYGEVEYNECTDVDNNNVHWCETTDGGWVDCILRGTIMVISYCVGACRVSYGVIHHFFVLGPKTFLSKGKH